MRGSPRGCHGLLEEVVVLSGVHLEAHACAKARHEGPSKENDCLDRRAHGVVPLDILCHVLSSWHYKLMTLGVGAGSGKLWSLVLQCGCASRALWHGLV